MHHCMSPQDRRLALGLLLSLLFHALLLSLSFGGQGLGLPAFAFPWQDRRIEALDLRAVGYFNLARCQQARRRR